MTDKVQKILAKIESLLYETNYEPFTDEVFGRIQSLKELKSYIDSLQEEPVSEDLEKEITKCYKSRIDLMMTRKQFGELIHHFTEWQKEQMMKDAIETKIYFDYECHDGMFGKLKIYNLPLAKESDERRNSYESARENISF